ncbi:MAG TPA: NAD-dependent epimerase/dehydratase family protein [Candidatus Dormibacteraeota bacterium]|nr:NAD-dependent epimerase/dehydratase family protein [Candidatus Dormibacteraeota bacterium]
MHILIIGGTRFLGRHIAESALSGGHRVTLFHRGRTMPDGLPGAENVIGDRADDIARLSERFDAVVDTCGYLPRDVAASCAHLHAISPSATYAFASSVSAYRDGFPAGADESASLWDTGDPGATEVAPETYGPLKALCEAAAIERFGRAALVFRPGLIVGPHDPSDRFTYWVRRVGDGGAVLAPGSPKRCVQLIDARDLAAWIVASLEERRGGTFNATGPLEPLAFGALLLACRAALESDAEFVWAPQDFLIGQGVEPWTEMPLWIPETEAGGWDSISMTRALSTGLEFRPLHETILDTWRWDRERDRGVPLKAGITAEREASLLEELRRGRSRRPE